MKKIYILAVAAAAICGILLYSFFSGYEKKEENIKVENSAATEQIVVAAQNISAYTEIKPEMVKLISIAKGSAHINAARKAEDVVGKITEREIVTDEQILTSMINEKGDKGTSLSYQIPEGMRAMSINVNVMQDVAGYLEEGDLIDIIAHISASSETSEKIKTNGNATKVVNGDITFTALSAVKILKLGDVVNRGSGKINTNITLLLTPKQCITLHNVWSQTGSEGFAVALRQKTDDSKVSMKAYSNKELME